jgi:SAM-dependent methyltransferase
VNQENPREFTILTLAQPVVQRVRDSRSQLVFKAASTGGRRLAMSVTTEYVGHDELLVLENAVRYNQHIADHFASVLPRLKVRPDRSPVIVDFGAGIGTISRLFKATTGLAPLAVEIDAHQRQVLSERGLNAAPGLSVVPDGSVDFIFSSNVIEHIEDDVEVLRELHGKLRPGGHLALWVPAFPALWTSLDDRVGHFRRYTVASVQETLEAAGFTACPVCYYQDSVGSVLALAFKFVGKTNGQISAGSVRLFDRWLFPVSRLLDVVCRRWFGKNVYVVAVKS